jgi:hypothetical protein
MLDIFAIPTLLLQMILQICVLQAFTAPKALKCLRSVHLAHFLHQELKALITAPVASQDSIALQEPPNS